MALPPGDDPKPTDLVDYCLDLQYMEVQGDLLRYALPTCLRVWRQSLLGETSTYEAFMENFYPALVDGGLFERLLSDGEGRAVRRFFERSILDAIDAQDALSFVGSPATVYRWVSALTTAGVILPDVADLWREWWSVETVGQACAVVQYASCLVYDEHDNAVFEPWTRDQGGGPPSLWEFSGHLYDRRWRDSNVAFLRELLTAESLDDAMRRATNRLSSLSMGAKAASVHADFKERIEVVQTRCRELPEILGTKQTSKTYLGWSR